MYIDDPCMLWSPYRRDVSFVSFKPPPGAWSASTESMRQSTGSGPSADRTSGSFKDSALDLHAPPPPVDPERTSQKGSIHGSLMDVHRNFTTMDSDAWLKQTLEQRSKTKSKDVPIKDLTQANLEAHDLRTLTNNEIVIDEEESSEYSVDQEGFYTSMHTDSGLSKRHSMHSVLSTSAKDENEPARYMFRSNMTLDSVIYRPKEDSSGVLVEGKSTDTLTAETPGYLSMNVVSKGPEITPPSVPAHRKNSIEDISPTNTAGKKKSCPPPPKRVSTLLRSNSTATDSIDSASAMAPMDSFMTPLLMPRSLSANSSLNNSKNTLNSAESESDHQHIYARVKMKTAINTSMYPSMCSVTPMQSDDETISLRSESRSDSDFTVSSIATPSPLVSSAPSPWSDFKSPYSTINRYKTLMKHSSISESTPIASGGYKSHTLPRKMSFKQFALKETEEEKRKRWSAENKSISSDDSGEHYNSNSWPRSPPFRQKKIAMPTVGGSITESKDEAPTIPPKPMIVKSSSNDSLKSNSSGGRLSGSTGSGEFGAMTGKAAMRPIPEIKTFSQYQELLKDVSPENPADSVTAADSMLSLSSSSSQSTGISSMSSGSGSGSEGTVPSKYQHMITVRPKSDKQTTILSPMDRPRINLMNSVDNQPSKVEYGKVREPVYANTRNTSQQRPLYANLNARPSIYANSLAKSNIYANTNNSPHIYSNSTGTPSGYANANNLDNDSGMVYNKISPPKPELIYAITDVVKSEATSKGVNRTSPLYATTNLVHTPPSSNQIPSDSAADTSSGYIQMSWPENKINAEVKGISSFMRDAQKQGSSNYSTLGSYGVAKQDTEKSSFKMTEDANKCVVVPQMGESAPKMASSVPKPFQPASFNVGQASTQNKYATIGKGRKLSVDANMVTGLPVGKTGSSIGPVISTGALAELARRNSSPSLTALQYSAPSRQVSVPDTILAEPSSPVEKTSTLPTTLGSTVIADKSEWNNNSVASTANKNKSRESLDTGLSKSRDSLSSTKSAKARISLDTSSKAAPLNDMDFLKRMKSLTPGSEQEELQKSRDSIDETAVMDILDSIRSTINNINNDKNNEVTSEQTSPRVGVTKAPFYGTTV